MATTYLTTPEVYPARNSAQALPFERDFMNRAATIGVQLACFGDSQETASSQGKVYCPTLQHMLNNQFQNIPGTGWVTFEASRQACLFVRTLLTGAPAVPASVDATYFPPSFESGGTSGPRVITDTKTCSATIQPDLFDMTDGVNALSWPASGTNLIDPAAGDSWVADVLYISKGVATAHATCSTTLNYQIRKSTSPTPVAYGGSGTLVASGSWTGLDSENTAHTANVLTTAAFTMDAAAKYTSVCLAAADANGVIVLAVRFRNVTRPQGVVCTWMSQGGYTVATAPNSITTNRNNAGTIIRAMGFDAAASFYGANDGYVGAGISAATWKTQMVAFIALIRGWAGKLLPWMIVSEQWRTEDSSGERDEYDQYPGVAAEICNSDPLVRAINSRRVLHALGWNINNENIASVSPTAWANTTAYTTASYVTSTYLGTLRTFKCTVNHTSDTVNFPQPGDPARYWWAETWKEVGRYLIIEAVMVHYTPEGGWIKAMVDASLMIAMPSQFADPPTRIPRGSNDLR